MRDDELDKLIMALGDNLEYDYLTQTKDEYSNTGPWDTDWDSVALWKSINKQAKTHPAVQAALDQLKMIYNLSKEDHNDEDLPF
jgi:hypothetical protein|tara:strand:- start:426 stop:677 length:252 start_codon:yes stop_codon:yes gene_type:complete